MDKNIKTKIFDEVRKNQNQNDYNTNDEPVLYQLSDRTISILTNRLRDEYTAHYYYRAAANWCGDMNYKKAAAYFTAEANTELTHAEGLQKYMVDFNVIPEILKTNTVHQFNDLTEVVYGAYEMELALMKAYNKDSQSILIEDITTFDFLTEYRKTQKESVVEYNDLINAINLIDKNDKFQVLYFEQTYF